eukprot:gene15870-22000_t
MKVSPQHPAKYAYATAYLSTGRLPGMTYVGRLPGMTYEGVPPAPGQLCATTKNGMDEERFTALAPVKPPEPSMYGSKNLTERLQTYGVPDALNYAMAGTQPLPGDLDRHMETTNQHFFDHLPREDMTTAGTGTKPLDYFDPANRTHYNKGTLRKDAYDGTRKLPEEETAGGKGSRGEITRNPKEGGNVYGVSVFVDEYSKWGTALPEKNMTLKESEARKTTKYF